MASQERIPAARYAIRQPGQRVVLVSQQVHRDRPAHQQGRRRGPAGRALERPEMVHHARAASRYAIRGVVHVG
jgi:hypothetical protein